MFLNIITPCSRPENLLKIAKSINIPKKDYRWIVVFDSEELLEASLIPNNCEYCTFKDGNSLSGNGQRNHGIDFVEEGMLYFNDDDTTFHSELWKNIKDVNADFISFSQANKDGTLRLKGEDGLNHNMDSHNFVVSMDCVQDTRWILGQYDADGLFAEACYKKAKNFLFIEKVLSVYNTLRV